MSHERSLARAIEARVIAQLAADLQYRALQVGGTKDIVIRQKIGAVKQRYGAVPQGLFAFPRPYSARTIGRGGAVLGPNER